MAVLVGLVACSPAPEGNQFAADYELAGRLAEAGGAVFREAPEMDRQIRAAVETFPEPLPSGAEWLTEAPENYRQSDTTYEDGIAEGIVTFHWLCSWEREFLDASDRGDVEGQRKSLAMVEQFTRTPWYEASVEDPEGGWLRDVVAPAKQGDASGIRKDFRNTCSQFSGHLPKWQ